MSIFYNFKLNPTRNADYNRIVKFEDFLESNVIENQSEYSVGVKRFKIPISNIDMYRVYENTQHIGLVVNSTSVRTHTIVNLASNIFPADLFDIHGWNNNDIDRNYKESPNDRVNQSGRFIPIFSQKDYANMLTRALARRAGTGDLLEIHKKHTSKAPVAPVLVKSIGQWETLNTIAPRTGANAPTGGQNKLVNYRCGLKTWRPREDGTTDINDQNRGLHKVSDLQFRLVIGSGSDQIIVYLGEGMYPSIQSYEKWLEFGFNDHTDTTNDSFGFTSDSSVSYERTKFNDGGYKQLNTTAAFQSVQNTSNSRLFSPNGYEDLDLLFRNYQAKEIRFQVRDNGGVGIGVTSGTVDDWGVYMRGFLEIIESDVSGNDGEGDLQNFVEFFPRFVFNDVTKKMEFLSTEEFHSSYSVYANSGLLSAIDFPICSRVNSGLTQNNSTKDSQVTYETLFSSPVYSALNPQHIEVDGVLLCFRNSTNTFEERNINNPTATTKVVSYHENEPSLWKRKFLNGIQIKSNRLAIRGEVGLGGNNRDKILTDFEIDPASTNRDYLIYSPSGNSVRFYPLNTTEPLNSVDCSVLYIDINGNSNPLMINPLMSASVKLEFRPNNMINNY